MVAVSGGVDSVALLHMLAANVGQDNKTRSCKYIVAHFDHGIRPDASLDRQLVQALAKAYGLQFVYDEGNLGADASEAAARAARYAFLERVRAAAKARAIITAHHQDDMLETAVINLLRGTHRRGVSALRERPGRVRPLLGVTKAQLVAYARAQGLSWREDSTNHDTRYARNRIRHTVLAGASAADKAALLTHVHTLRQLNDNIDTLLLNYLHQQPAHDRLDRQAFIGLPHTVAREVMAAWLREHKVGVFDRKTLERLVVAGKTFKPAQRTNVVNGWYVQVKKDHLALVRGDR